MDGNERREMRDLVRGTIDQLPPAQREIILLRDIERFDTARTAQMLGLSLAAVKTRLHRARQALRALLENAIAGRQQSFAAICNQRAAFASKAT